MSDHLTEPQLQRYLTGLSPTELLAADEHLSDCPDCRSQLQTLRNFTPVVENWRTALLAETEWTHPAWEELSAYAAQKLDEVEQEIIASHLATCSDCQLEYQDLSAFASHLASFPQREFRPPDPPSTWQKLQAFWGGHRGTSPSFFQPLKLAGACAVIALLVWFGVRWWRGRTVPVNQPDIAVNSTVTPRAFPTITPPPSPTDAPTTISAVWESGAYTIRLDTNGKLSGVENLSTAEEKSLRAALQNGKVELPAMLNQLRTGTDKLMGKSGEDSFRLLSPNSKIIRDRRPTFRWEPLSSASSYVVTVADGAGGFLLSSPPQTTTQWTPPSSLPRGKTLLWQVSATRDGREIKSPASAAPEVRFHILAKSNAADIVRAERLHARNPLLLGVTYAQQGLLDEAETQFQLVLKQNPNSLQMRQLLQVIRAAKK